MIPRGWSVSPVGWAIKWGASIVGRKHPSSVYSSRSANTPVRAARMPGPDELDKDDRPKPARSTRPWQSDTGRPLRIAAWRLGGAWAHIGQPEVGWRAPSHSPPRTVGTVFHLAGQARFGWVCLWPRFYLVWYLFCCSLRSRAPRGPSTRFDGPSQCLPLGPNLVAFLALWPHQARRPTPERARARALVDLHTKRRGTDPAPARARARPATPRFGTVLAAF